MRVWERGTGETFACGTGACASAVACILNGLTDDEVTVRLLGGELNIRWDREANLVYMTGPTEIVFDGRLRLKLNREYVVAVPKNVGTAFVACETVGWDPYP